MLSLVPITCFLIVFLIFQKSLVTASWRGSFLSASLVWGILLTAITELLSLFHLLDFWEILGLWVLSAALGLIYLIRVNDGPKSFNVRSCLAGISRFELLLLAAIGIIVFAVGIIGWIAPPNNWDSMTYHMGRVVHWIQNSSVANYPTNIVRQLYENPWAEFAILHFQILSGTDRFANLIQWFSMIGSALGVSLLAKQLGASSRGQILAAAVSVTIPMGILQGSSTQNDYVVSFWLVCFTYFAIRLKEDDQHLYSLATGAGLGLSILTKATAYFFAFPFMAWISLSLIKSRHARGLLQIILVVTTAFVINLGHYTRNYDLFGSPLGPSGEGGSYTFSNDIFTVSSLTSNTIRNVGLHIGTPFDGVNAFLENGIYQLHRIIGIDPNDSRTTWPGTEFHVLRISRSEDTAGNPLHLVLIILSMPILLLHQPRKKDTIYYFVCLLGAFIFFSLYLKWQPWNSRLQLPLFILWSPLIGLSLSQLRVQKIANLGIVILLLGALPYLVYNSSRPILGQESIMATSRIELYFRNRLSLAKPYFQSVEFLSNTECSDIGLALGGDDWEYPFWVLLNENGKRTVRLEHVNVTNISEVKSSEYPFSAFTPCAVIVVSDNSPDELHVGDVTYFRRWLSDPVSVFLLQ
jgi:4-amino-4-deoxy-L-arabinose transferase-like glycosyltransferase